MNSDDPKKLTPEERAPFGKVKLTIEYDGTHYCGWQYQGDEIPTIQGNLEAALSDVFKKKIVLVGAGRTDAGVHAENQVAHFIAPRDVKGFNFVHLFQAYLAPDVTIKKAEWVPAHFHAQRSSTSKTYIYRIWNETVPSGLRARRSLWIRKPLDIDRLNERCKILLGKKDFKSFRSEGSAVRSTERTIYEAQFAKVGDFLEFRIRGNGFLKQMVRNIVGTLIQIELGGREDNMEFILAACDRTQAGPSAQPQGLFLSQVYYPPELDKLSVPL